MGKDTQKKQKTIMIYDPNKSVRKLIEEIQAALPLDKTITNVIQDAVMAYHQKVVVKE